MTGRTARRNATLAALRAERAAATALLERVHADIDFRDHAPLLADIRAHLGEQPAAPHCNYAGRCNSSRCPLHGQPAAPARVTFTTVQGETLSTCTLADLEVLKEMNAVPTRTLERTNPLDDYAGPARAELARR